MPPPQPSIVMNPEALPSTDSPDCGTGPALLVVGFCAAWCNTCGDFRRAFDDLARRRPTDSFVWLDIEDDADVVGDIDIENFPTLAVFSDDRLLHFGVSLPQGPIVARVLDSLDAASPTVAAAPAVTGLPERLRCAPRTPPNDQPA